MAITLAITNAKGGVGKTTTCANLGAALSAAGKRVLLVDNDPQGDLTRVMLADPKSLKYTLSNLMNAILDDAELEDFADKALIEGNSVHYIPANSKLAGVSNRLIALQMSSRYRGGDAGGTPCEMVMSRVLEYFQERYDYILIDCGHSMDLLTINALAAADQAIVPVQAHYLAMEDMADTLDVIRTIQLGINPKLTVGGILLTMYQGRTNLCRSIQKELQSGYGGAFVVFSSPIDYTIRVAEHPIAAASIFDFEPDNPAARAYSAVAQEVLSYRSKSLISGRIIGVDGNSFYVRNKETGALERRRMYCAVVIAYRVKVLIPETEFWMPGEERPTHVLRNMTGAEIDYMILDVDREGGVAIASRRMGAAAARHRFDTQRGGHSVGERLTCRVLAVGPSRCLLECGGRDITLGYRDMSYANLTDLREKYHPGQTLDCVLTAFNRASGEMEISVKEAEPHPFQGIATRHPIGSRRYATITGKYGGGVFCTLPDGTTCMSLYTPQHTDRDFHEGDTVILVITQFDYNRCLIYGRILAKW